MDPTQYLWWLASRASGIVALGLDLGLRVRRPARCRRSPCAGRRSSARLLRLHEHVALAGLVAISVHGLTLLGDHWLKPGLTGIAVPFAMSYRPLFTAAGIVGGYLAAALGLSYYARRRIGAPAVAAAAPRHCGRVGARCRAHARRRKRRQHGLAARDRARERRPDRVPRARARAPGARPHREHAPDHAAPIDRRRTRTARPPARRTHTPRTHPGRTLRPPGRCAHSERTPHENTRHRCADRRRRPGRPTVRGDASPTRPRRADRDRRRREPPTVRPAPALQADPHRRAGPRVDLAAPRRLARRSRGRADHRRRRAQPERLRTRGDPDRRRHAALPPAADRHRQRPPAPGRAPARGRRARAAHRGGRRASARRPARRPAAPRDHRRRPDRPGGGVLGSRARAQRDRRRSRSDSARPRAPARARAVARGAAPPRDRRREARDGGRVGRARASVACA